MLLTRVHGGRGEVEPFRVYFVRRICENVNKTKVLQKLGLKNGRAYLGAPPTFLERRTCFSVVCFDAALLLGRAYVHGH